MIIQVPVTWHGAKQPFFSEETDLKKALVIGAAGFVGNYLINHLAIDKGMEVYATKLAHESLENDNAQVFDLNILEK